jgi:thiol-disulfide isomerase/thioredoxin
MKPPRILPILVLGLALLAPACSGKGAADPTGQAIKAATSYNVGDPISPAKRKTPKAWNGESLTGDTIRSDEFNGAVTVVNFWASWCGPCRVEQASLEKVWRSYQAKGVRFLGVDIRDKRVPALAHVGEFNVTYPSVQNEDSTIAYKFRVIFIPTTFVLDREGRIARKIIGPTNEADLKRVIDEAMAA